jgi:hypothetical protein
LPDIIISYPKPPLLVDFGRPWNEKIFDAFFDHVVYILCGHLLSFLAIWSFVTFSPFLVQSVLKKLSTLPVSEKGD